MSKIWQIELATKMCNFMRFDSVQKEDMPIRYRGNDTFDALLRKSSKVAAICTKDKCPACVRFESKKERVKTLLEKHGYEVIDVDCATPEGVKILINATPEGDSATVPNVILFNNERHKKVHPEELLAKGEDILLTF